MSVYVSIYVRVCPCVTVGVTVCVRMCVSEYYVRERNVRGAACECDVRANVILRIYYVYCGYITLS